MCLTPVSPTCTKTDKSIVMPFGKQTRVGPRNPVLHEVHVGVMAGRLKTQVRKTKVRICNGGKRKYSNLKSILKSLRFSSLAVSVDPLSVGLDQFTSSPNTRPVLYTRNRTHDGLVRRRAWVQKSQARRCRVTVLGKLFTPTVPQAAKLVAALLRVARVTAGLAESNGSLPPGL